MYSVDTNPIMNMLCGLLNRILGIDHQPRYHIAIKNIVSTSGSHQNLFNIVLDHQPHQKK